MREAYDSRRRYLVQNLNRIGLTCFEPKGAFYVFPDIRSTGLSSEEFCDRLLMEEHVAVIPGSAFGPGGEGFVYHEILSDLVHIDVHVLRGPREEDGTILYTTGMSDLPMSLPEEIADREDLKYAELYMLLPGDWDLGKAGSNPKDLPYERFWPIQMLKFLARFPHEYKTWLGWGHTSSS